MSNGNRARLSSQCTSHPKFAGWTHCKLCVIILSVIPQASCTGVPRVSLLALSSWLTVFVAAQVCADTKHVPPTHSVDLESATAGQLQQVSGIGPGTAKAIVSFRQKSGPFQKVEELLAIKGCF